MSSDGEGEGEGETGGEEEKEGRREEAKCPPAAVAKTHPDIVASFSHTLSMARHSSSKVLAVLHVM